MKKFSKILCAVLMLALICTSLAFLVSADNTPDTVTATVKGTDLAAVSVSGIEGNALTANGSFDKYLQMTDPNGDGVYSDGANTEDPMVTGFVVQPSGGDGYGVIWAGPKQNGGSFQNFQHTYSYKGVELTEDSYYVVDLDIATATALISGLNLSLPNRNVVEADNSGWNGFPFGQNVVFCDWLSDLGSEWTHFTVVCSIKTNQQYIFVNGVFQGTTGAHAYNASQRTEGTTLHANGIKLEVPYTASTSNAHMIYANESVAYDNLARRDIVDAEGIAALDAIIGSEEKDLTKWAGYPTEVRTGSLPAYVEIDGVQYNNLDDASKVLTGNITKTVNVLNSFPGRLSVQCDATVNMNGCTGEIASVEGATITEENGVVTVDAPYIASKSEELATDAAFKAAFGYQLPAFIAGTNVLGAPRLLYMNGLDDGNNQQKVPIQGASAINVTNNLTGEQYLMMGPGAKGANTYIALYSQTEVKKGDGQRFFVLDMDIELFSDSTNLGWYAVCRGTSGCFGTNVRSGDFISATAATKGTGMHHYTTVLDMETNKAYTFLDGVLISTVDSGAYGSGAAQYEAGFKFEQFRLFSSNEDSFAVDNIAVRKAADVETLAAAIEASDITLWSEYYANQSFYTYTEIAPLASVNGKTVYTASDLASLLTGKALKEVELYSHVADEIVVECDAVINTNGLTANFKAGTDVTSSTEGNVMTFDAPWVTSATEVEVTDASFIIDTSVSGNLYAGRSGVKLQNNTGDVTLSLYKVTDTATGNTYLKIKPNGTGKNTKNIYLTTEIIGAATAGDSSAAQVIPDGQGYIVHEFDIATDSTIIGGMTIDPVCRNNASEGGTFPFGASEPLGNMVTESTGKWSHVVVVGDLAANKQHVFVDGVYVGYDHYANQKAGEYELLNIKGARFNLGIGQDLDVNQTTLLDNVSVRAIKPDSALATTLAAAVAANDITSWDGYVAGLSGTATPAVVNIDGVSYSSVKAASAALVGDGVSELVIERDFVGAVTTNKSVKITDNGIKNKVVANAQPEVIDGVILGSNFHVTDTAITKLNKNNYASLTVETLWYAGLEDYESETAIYFPEGAQIEYVGDWELQSNYIEDGKLYNQYWTDFTAKVTEFPVAEKGKDYFYAIDSSVEDTALTVQKDLKYNMSLYANFNVNLYIPAANGVTGTIKAIGGVDHVLVTKSVAANAVDGDVVYYIDFTVDGVTYTEKVVVSILNYAEAVLASETVSDHMKRVMVAALEYANEAAKLLNGAESAAIAAIVAANEQHKIEDNTEYGEVNTDALASVLAGAQLKLDSSVAFVLKVADGYNGEIVIEYADYKGQQFKVTKTVKGGDVIVLDDFKIYNIDSTLTITAGEVTGTYNLGGYIKGLVEAGTDAEFAKALFTYAKVAQSYKAALNEAAQA